MPDITFLSDILIKFAWLGNWIFFILAFVESAPFVGVFIPGATLVYVGGFLASQGLLNVWDILIFATLGAIVGDFFSYSIGRWGGDWVKRKKIINQNILDIGENFFNKYGHTSIFWGRFFGPVRAIIPFIAGLSRMKTRPFVFWNILSAIGWAMFNVFLGYFSGTIIVSIFKKWSGRLSIIIVIALVIFLIYWIIKKRGESIREHFHNKSINFTKRVHTYTWFQKLSVRFPVIPYFFNERKNAEKKFFGGFLISIFLLIIYLLIIILDVF